MKSSLTSLVRFFPRAFRDQFAHDMLDQIERDYVRAQKRGIAATAWFTVTTAFDMLRAAIGEQFNPTFAAAPAPSPEKHGMRWSLNEWTRDIGHSMRALRRTPAFTSMAVGTLALAIGVNAALFSVVDTVLLHPLPFTKADRLVHIGATAPGSDFPAEFGVSSEFYIQYKEQSKLLEDVSTYNSFTSTMRVDDRVERIRMSQPTNSMYSTLAVSPILGRVPVAEDGSRVMVISYTMWKGWFGGDSSIIGKSYFASGTMRTVIGVMGPRFKFPTDDTMLWIPGEIRNDSTLAVGRFNISLVGRMAPGATTESVARELTALASRLPERFGGSARYAKLMTLHHAVVRPATEQLLGAVASPLWILVGAVGIVLLIACANVANLFMVRTEGRHREMAVRRAIGAGMGQLVRLQMSESVVVAGMAAVLAVVFALVALPMFVHAAPAGIPRIGDVKVTGVTVVAAFGFAILAAIVCGIVPSLRAASPDLSRLREGGRGSTRKSHWLRNSLVVGQTALALVLLIGSGLLVRSFARLSHVDPGYDTRDIFTFQIAPDQPGLRDGPAFARFDLEFMDRMRELPGVQAVGLIENVPLNEGTAAGRFRGEGSVNEQDGGPLINYNFTAGDYFKAMSIKVLGGRVFETADHTTPRMNVIVSKSAAQMLWPGEDPVGKRLLRNGDSTLFTVVGMVADVMQNSFRDTPAAVVYFPLVGPTPLSWAESSPAYVVKTARAEFIAPDIRAIVKRMAPESPMYRMFTLEGLASTSMVQLSFTMLTLIVVSSLALLLGAVGVYGVLSYVVAERTREIGVRMALGAKAGQVRRMVVAQGTRVVLIGVAIGVTAAFFATKALGALLFDVKALDVATFVAMPASMIAIGLLASYLPARRASNVDPIESLRGDS